MKIVYLSSTPFADCDFPLIKEWQQQGHDVYFFIDLPCYLLHSNIINIENQIQKNDIFLSLEYEEFKFFEKYLNLDKVYVINRTRKSAFAFSNIYLQIKLNSFISKIEPDVIALTSAPDMFKCLIYKYRKKLVLTVHDPFPHTGEKALRTMIFRRLAFKIIPKFVLLNKTQKQKFKKYWQLNENQICINKLGSYDCTALYLNRLEIKKTFHSILFFGRISPYKGIEYLLEAMKLVHEQIPYATLTIAGSGAMYFNMTPYKDLSYVDIQNRYIDMKELANLINQCSIVVCPYIDATQSGVVQTVFALNKPVIATNVGAMSEYIEDGKTGMLVPPCNSEKLAEAIIEVLKNNEYLVQMENNIKKLRDSKSGSWRGIAKKYIDFYLE